MLNTNKTDTYYFPKSSKYTDHGFSIEIMGTKRRKDDIFKPVKINK